MITYNTSQAQDAITAVAESLSQVQPYLQAMAALLTTPQPLVVDGVTAAEWNPLTKLPATQSALLAAQQHCASFHTDVVAQLALFPAQLAATASAVKPDFNEVLSMLAQWQGSTMPTAAERAAVQAACSDIEHQVSLLSDALTNLASPTATFIAQQSSDSEVLTNGDVALPAAILTTEEEVGAAFILYGAMPFVGKYVAKLILQVGGEIVDTLKSVQACLADATSASTAVPGALSDLQGIFITLQQDLASVGAAISSASDQDLPSVLQQLNAQDALSFWQNASAFAAGSGLGEMG